MYRPDENAAVATLNELLKSSRSLFGGSTAVLDKAGEVYNGYTYDRLFQDSYNIGAGLRAHGLAGKHIAICGQNCYRWVAAYFAVVGFCGVVVPLSRTLTPETFLDAATVCNITAVIYGDDCKELIGILPEEIQRFTFSELDALATEGQSFKEAAAYEPASSDLAELAYTSGTEGKAKAVMLTHKNICFSVTELRLMIKAGTDDTLYSVLPLTHAYERICGLLYPLYCGACVAYGDGLRHLTSNLRVVCPTIMLCVPLILDKIYEKIWQNIERKGIGERVRRVIKLTDAAGPLRSAVRRQLFAEIHDSLGGRLSLIITGGSPAKSETIMGLRDFGIRALQGYGLTECAALVSVNRVDLHEYTSAGMQTPGGLIDIYNIQSDGIGEIRYRGDNVMSGYFGQPELSKKVLCDGWLYTGDMGYFDRRGFLHIIGRRGNMILTAKRKQIFPEELEAELLRNPFICEAVVVGVKNEENGDNEPVAVIYPDNLNMSELYGGDYSSDELTHELGNAVRAVNLKIEDYKQIRKFIVRREPFEKNDEGKILRAGIASKAERSLNKS